MVISDKVIHGITMVTSLGKEKNEGTKGDDRPGENAIF